jgi:hypothetical protein
MGMFRLSLIYKNTSAQIQSTNVPIVNFSLLSTRWHPVTIITTVAKAVITSITTAQTIYGYVVKYNIADIEIVAMTSECSAVLLALLKFQKIVIQNSILQQAQPGGENKTLANVQTDYRGILSQYLAVFAL